MPMKSSGHGFVRQAESRERETRGGVSSETHEYARLIGDAVPRILKGLERRGWPDGQMITFSVEVPGLFKTKWESRESAAWVIDRPTTSLDFAYTVFLLSDGRICQQGRHKQLGTHIAAGILGRPASSTQADLLRILWTGKAAWSGQEGKTGLRALLARYSDEPSVPQETSLQLDERPPATEPKAPPFAQ